MKEIKINQKLIFDYINENNLSIKTFCNLCGFSKGAFNNVLKGVGKSLKFVKVAKVINVRLCDLFDC